MPDFRRFVVWHRAHAMTLDIFRLAAKVRTPDLRFLMDQLRRASASIGANIAEGAAQESPAQFARFLAIALGSTSEVINHALLARDLGAFTAADAELIDVRAQELRAMLIALRRKVRSTKPN